MTADRADADRYVLARIGVHVLRLPAQLVIADLGAAVEQVRAQIGAVALLLSQTRPGCGRTSPRV